MLAFNGHGNRRFRTGARHLSFVIQRAGILAQFRREKETSFSDQ